jgi:o-succinylbenzoate synthase
MIVKNIKWIPYILYLKSSFSTSNNTLAQRKIIIVQIEDENGNLGYGEAAPLPEFGSESYDEVEKALQQSKELLLEKQIDAQIESFIKILDSFSSAPTAQSALEQAVFTLLNQQENKSIFNRLPVPQTFEIELNGLIGLNSPQQAAEIALVLRENGYKTIKLKVGRSNFSADLQLLKIIRKTIKDKLNIRLDVNGKWTLDEAAANLNMLREFNIQYVEQPVNKLEDLKILANKNIIPIAADESIRNISDAKEALDNSEIKFVVVKPMLFGGILKTLSLFELAEQYSKEIIISSSFESALGYSNLVYLSSVLNSSLAQGISTLNYFSNDLSTQNLKIENGSLIIPTDYFPPKQDLSHLFEK